MTREEAKEFMWLENDKNPSVIKWQHHKTIRNLVEKLIYQLFNDHEAQLKAKDEEIRRLNNLYADTIKDLVDALIKIERLIINT